MNNLFGPLSPRVAFLCLALSFVVAVAAYVIGRQLPAVYQSSGTIRIATQTEGGIGDPNVIAANDLATEYAQLVGSEPVSTSAAKRLGVPASDLRGKFSGSTVAAQNLLQVTVTGTSASQAEARARAGVDAVYGYLTALTQQQNAAYVSALKRGILAQLSTTPGPKGTAADPHGVVAVTARDQVLAQAVRDAAGNQPSFQIVDPSVSATETSPRPKLYALVSLVVALIITARIAFVMSRPVRD